MLPPMFLTGDLWHSGVIRVTAKAGTNGWHTYFQV